MRAQSKPRMRVRVSSLQEERVIPASSSGSQEGAQARIKLTAELFRDSPAEELMVSSELSYLKAVHQPRVFLLSFLKKVIYIHIYGYLACMYVHALRVVLCVLLLFLEARALDGLGLELQTVTSCHVGPGIGNSLSLSHLSSILCRLFQGIN